MALIYHRGNFNRYRLGSSSNVLNESHQKTVFFSKSGIRYASGTTVFVSHKNFDFDIPEL